MNPAAPTGSGRQILLWARVLTEADPESFVVTAMQRQDTELLFNIPS